MAEFYSANCQACVIEDWTFPHEQLKPFQQVPWIARIFTEPHKYLLQLWRRLYVPIDYKETVLRKRLEHYPWPQIYLADWTTILFAEARLAPYADTPAVLDRFEITQEHVGTAVRYLYFGDRRSQLEAVRLISFVPTPQQG